MRAIIIRNHPVFYHLILSLCLIQVKILFLLTTPTKSWWGRPRFHSRSPTNLMSPVRPMLRWTPRLCCSSKLILQIQGQQNRLIWLFNGFLNVPFFFVSFFSAPRGSLWMWSGSSLGRLWLRSWTHQQAQNRSEIRFRANKVTWVHRWCCGLMCNQTGASSFVYSAYFMWAENCLIALWHKTGRGCSTSFPSRLKSNSQAVKCKLNFKK